MFVNDTSRSDRQTDQVHYAAHHRADRVVGGSVAVRKRRRIGFQALGHIDGVSGRSLIGPSLSIKPMNSEKKTFAFILNAKSIVLYSPVIVYRIISNIDDEPFCPQNNHTVDAVFTVPDRCQVSSS